MKRLLSGFFLAVLIVPSTRAAQEGQQEKPKAEQEVKEPASPKEITPLRVQVVFSEYEGEKKLSSLPYILLINADEHGAPTALRMELRLPVETGPNTRQYMDVGTNMDGRAEKTAGGRFSLHLSVERSSLYRPGSEQKSGSSSGGEAGAERPSSQPVVQHFRSQLNLLMRDGQTIQATLATDPVSGRLLKVEVTLNVAK